MEEFKYKDEIISSRVGFLGGSDGNLLSSVASLGKIKMEEVRIFYNFKDFFRFVQNYEGELNLKRHFEAYEGEKLVAKIIKNK